ncbi:Rap1-interacting factor 1 N terminal-domain-containing protein [Aspergillus egyptiacus]|nr:Rap1-interacting factor 1 N terminal-domain-containing protein [Aspergillus egyptiacus]
MLEVAGPLSARPPTPPRTATHTLSEQDRMGDSPVIIQTPVDSPFLANGSTDAPSSRHSKRVNFSPWPNYIKPPSFTNTKSKALLPSNDSKPARSILKSTNSPGPVTSTEILPYTPETFVMLLESVTQQLAGESTSSRVDAYMQFFGALRAYERLPTEEEIIQKLGLITQFIQRDISRDLTKGGPLDINLVTQALKLSVVLVWHPQISTQLPDEFKLFLIEHSVSCLEEGKLPKSVMNHYLSVLSTQRFQTKVITNARMTRILTMLDGLSEKVKGNAVVSQRLVIYERLFELSKSAFISQPALWMDHLISGLLHQFKDIRLKAITLGFNAYMASGSNPALSKALRDIFDRPLPNKRKMVSEICERMSRMMANPETGEHVPQIWGVITLLLRSKRFNIDQWPHFKEWVLVLQKCFNCSDPDIKSKAFGNWNRFMLVVNISETTTRSLLRMLSKPILSQFDRKKQEKQGAQPSQLVVASYYNLLYYAFRPDASHQQLDVVWEEYIASPSSKTFAFVSSLSDKLAHALSNMLWNSHSLKAWTDNRVNEPKRIVAEELPLVDCKWVRSRIFGVLKVFEDLFKSSVWGSEMEKSNIAGAWISLSHALAFAASKEITPSPESMQAVAHVLGLLQRLWNAAPSSLNALQDDSMDTFFDRFRFLANTMIVALGNISFTEKLLLKTADLTYHVTNTPTNRHSKSNNNPDSPLLHLLRLVIDDPLISEPTTSYSSLIDRIVEAACHGRVTRGSRLDVLRQCADLCPSGHQVNFTFIVWKSTARLVADCLGSFPPETARERDGSVSRDYENVVNVLSKGLMFPDSSSAWNRLLSAFISALRAERGDHAVMTTVLEPLAASMMGLDVPNAYHPATTILNHSLTLFSPNSENAASLPSGLVELARRILRDSYEQLEQTELNTAAVFIESIVASLGSGTTASRSLLLDKLQEPISLYFKDASGKVAGGDSVESSSILTAYRALATAVLNILQLLPYDAMTLLMFERIICAGLVSAHTSTADQFGDFWCSTFGTKHLYHPPTISQALRQREARISTQAAKPSIVDDPCPPQWDLMTDSNKSRISNNIATETTSIISKDMSVKSRIAFILDPPASHSTRHDSSPVTNGPETAAPASQQTGKPSEPPQDPAETVLNDTSVREDSVDSLPKDTARHREVFSIIDNLRSSSPPTDTPRKFGLVTPPRVHALRHDCGTETPETPTIPAVNADNEDGFLGSSPTPAIRGRAHSVGSAIASSLATAGSMELDPPSSPPELEPRGADSDNMPTSQNSTPRNRVGKNKRRRNKTRRSRLSGKEDVNLDLPQKQPTEPSGESAVQSLRSRLRSATDTISANNEDAADEQTQAKTNSNDAPHESAESASEPEVPEKPQPDPPSERADTVESDTDTQVMSQLEQDLVSAADFGGSAADREIIASADQVLATRKRKREQEEDARTPSQASSERRRSSRLSTTAPTTDAEGIQTSRSKKQKLAAVAHKTLSSPPGSAAKKGKHGPVTPKPSPKHEQAKKEKVDRTPSSAQKPSQNRRSFRISGHGAPDIPEDNAASKRSPRPSSSRKQNKKQKKDTVEGSLSQRSAGSPATPLDEIAAAREGAADIPNEDHGPLPTGDISEQHLEAQISPEPSQARNQAGEVEQAGEPIEVLMEEVQGTVETVAAPGSNPLTPLKTQTEKPTETPAACTTPAPEPAPAPKPQQEDKETEPEPKPQSNSDTGITTSLRTLLDQVKIASLDRDTVKEMDDLLFDLRVEMHEALRRHRDATAPANQ